MKTFRNKFTIIALSLSAAFASCTTEEDPDNFDDRDDFTGNWSCQETGTSSGTSSYTVSISKSTTDSTAILISNFYGLGNTQKAIGIVDGNSLTIPQQPVDNLNVLGGSGTLTGSTINLNYAVSDGSVDNVTATYTR